MAEHLGVSGVCLADGTLSSKSWYNLFTIGQIRCVVDDVFTIILIKPWRMKRCSTHRDWSQSVAKEITKVESSKENRSLTCCSVTSDSKSHLVAPAVSTDDYRVFQEDARRRLSEEEQRALDLATEEERETARTMVSSRLHVELGHSDPRGVIDSLSKKTRTQTHRRYSQKVQLQCM